MLSFPSPRWEKALRATKLSTARLPGLKAATSMILPNLFLSNCWIARDEAELTRHGITHVVSLLEHDPDIPACIDDDNCLWIKVADRPEADLLHHLEQTTAFIREALEGKNNKVLVRFAGFRMWLDDVFMTPSRSTASKGSAGARLLCAPTCVPLGWNQERR